MGLFVNRQQRAAAAELMSGISEHQQAMAALSMGPADRYPQPVPCLGGTMLLHTLEVATRPLLEMQAAHAAQTRPGLDHQAQ